MISKDSNVVVVAESINCCGLLAKGLRKDFSSWARNLTGLLLEKFKVRVSCTVRCTHEGSDYCSF